jgi:hypothetical protein
MWKRFVLSLWLMRSIFDQSHFHFFSALFIVSQQTQYVRRTQYQATPIKPQPAREKPQSKLECIPLLKAIQYDPKTPNIGPEFEYECELLDKTPVSGGSRTGKILKLDNLPDNLLNEIDSGRDILTIEDATITKDFSIQIKPGKAVKIDKGPGQGNKDDKKGGGKRRLSETVDVSKTVLVVRVNAGNGTSTATPTELSDSVFGTAGDPVNLQSQYDACSYQKMRFIPAANRSAIGGNGADIVNGATEVDIPTMTSEGAVAMRDAITETLQATFGVNYADIADYFMYCLPKGTMTSIACK